jgi:alginate O-acetyltransferase complex protein AlgI
MIYTSFNFLIFFPSLLVIYFITPSRFKWFTLLIASYFFYINIKPVFALLVVGVTLSTYFFTLLIDKTENESKRKVLMIINILLILLPLFFFKYFTSINEGIFSLLSSMHIRWPLPEIKLLLPIGISFYTFMAIGYTIDVYNEKLKAEKNIGIFALFISFFPLVLSGPIERAKNMLPQFKAKLKLDYYMVVKGLKFMLWGYFMKLVVADRIGIYVDAVYNNIPHHNGTSLLCASLLYPFQVYADLGGYSLIAIGVSSIMGIKVMQNFKRPFFATSMSEFWRRWHISLISWLTDYVYTPLSFTFRKFGVWGIVFALMITFLISGLWHGAEWTFVMWGIMQGLFLSIEALINKKRTLFEIRHNLSEKNWYNFIGIFTTFILFSASQIFGRTSTISDSFIVFAKIFSAPGYLFSGTPSNMIYIIFALSMLFLKDLTDELTPSRFLLFENKYKIVRIAAYSFVAILILLIGVFDGGQFIYFQF